MAVRFKQLSKTSTEWTSLNPTLLEGEIGFESDTNRLKVGNGSDTWNDLEYVTGSSSDLDTSNLVDLTSEQTITGVKTFNSALSLNVTESNGYGGIKIQSSLSGGDPNINIGYNTMGSNTWGVVVLGYDNNLTASSGGQDIIIGESIRCTHNSGTSDNNIIILGNGTTSYSDNGSSIHIGYDTFIDSEYVRVGTLSGQRGISIGAASGTTADDAIQFGYGKNSIAKTVQFWDYQLLDGNTGKIPTERLNLGTKKYLHRITLNLSNQVSGTAPTKMAVIHLDYYSEQETAYTNPNFATIALANSIRCSGYYTDTDMSLTEKNFVYEIALPQSNEFVLNSSFSITIQSTGSSITDEVIGYIFS